MTYSQFLPPSAEQPPPAPRPTALRRGLSYLWALVPLVTFGFGTPFVIGYAAVRLRSIWQWLATGLYAVVFVIMVAGSGAADGSAGATLFDIAFTSSMVVGTVHAFVIRSRVVGRPGKDAFDIAIAAAKARQAARDRSRELAADDPALARELHIGRPDLPRSFDDGGLVDVNTAPPAVLAGLPGMTPRLVDQILRAREDAGAFISAEELSVAAQLPPALTDTIAEYAIFLT